MSKQNETPRPRPENERQMLELIKLLRQLPPDKLHEVCIYMNGYVDGVQKMPKPERPAS